MKTKIFLFAIGIFILSTLNGQQRWNLRTNGGIATGSEIVDGYYFSFDIGIPVVKSLQLVPTFSFADMLPNTYFSSGWKIENSFPDCAVPTGGPRQEQEYGQNLNSISFLVVFMPFELFNSEKLKKHELMIGAGVSHNSYTMVSSHYDINGEDYTLIAFSVKSNKSIEPYYCKLGYNYLFKENLFIGIVAGINGYDGEAEMLTGVQFGVKF